ncbi:MAG: PAS domain-containing protein [Bryobacteraceae bacterium]
MDWNLLLNPFTIMSVLLCVMAVGWCVVLLPRLRFGKDRFLVAMVGLLSVHHGARIMAELGGWLGHATPGLGPAGTFVITGIYAAVVLAVNYYTAEHRSIRYQLRLSEAREALPALSPVPVNMLQQQEMSHALLESSPLPMYALDPTGAICYWNSAAERLFGWSRSEVLGQRLPELNSIVTRESSEAQRTLKTKDGTELRAGVWTAPMRMSGDAMRGTLTIVSSHQAMSGC